MALVLLLLAGCGNHTASTLTGASPTPTHTSTPIPPAAPGVHFATPEAAMRYLASAWNRNDLTALKHVTDPKGYKSAKPHGKRCSPWDPRTRPGWYMAFFESCG